MLKSIFNTKKNTCKILWVILVAIILLSLLFQYMNLRKKHFMNKEKFDETTTTTNGNDDDEKLLFFYADWCGYCTEFKPVIEQFRNSGMIKKENFWEINENPSKLKEDTKQNIANALNISPSNDSEISVAVQQLMTEFDVKGFPAVIYKKGSTNQRFSDSRTIESLTNFINTMREQHQ